MRAKEKDEEIEIDFDLMVGMNKEVGERAILNRAERFVIAHYMGIRTGKPPMTLAQVAAIGSCSIHRVRYLKKKAIEKLCFFSSILPKELSEKYLVVCGKEKEK